MSAAGHNIETILICGGLSQNPLFTQIQADVLGLPVLCPLERQSVLIGAAILGACATKRYSMYKTITKMARQADVVKPTNETYK